MSKKVRITYVNNVIIARVQSFIIETSKDQKEIPFLIFQGEHREIKVQCMDKDAHSIWVQVRFSLFFLKKKEGNMGCYSNLIMTFFSSA